MDDRLKDAVEELTVQQIILDSLDGQTWDGIEEERGEALQSIERLKRQIKKLRQDRAQIGDGNEVGLPASQKQSSPGPFNRECFPAARLLMHVLAISLPVLWFVQLFTFTCS
ncbi:hypothetical protein NOR_02699 [Metarhizium rileyi]|uniref:Uncharacterized protein n=1 Tax=Metarhizium rileyi (strain RCEF 4871) TaxID=1649241 RepID=A0A162JTC4_METRR|nr:hypothetical protein NOR_02699 [Metarhizium rileyi RCEF 4871]TWU75135.1 hypothetical protein ED733_002892 [Metarhizium rileyi]